MHRIAVVGVGLVLVVALVLSGCGSSKKTTATASATGTTAAPKTTSAPNFHGSSNSKFCDLARQLEAKAQVSPNADLKTTYAQLDSEISQILAVTPSAIKADMVTLTTGIRKIRDALAAANYDVTKLDPSSLQSLDSPEFKAAGDRVSAYGQQVCGITTTTG
jgi:hypothetical protein